MRIDPEAGRSADLAHHIVGKEILVLNTSGTVPDTTDRDPLVAAAMRGDGEAIRTLWERNRRWIAAVLLAHKPVFEDLDDLLQEVAVTFVSKIGTLRNETNLRAWLRTIAVNTARAAGRSGRYRPRPELPEYELHDRRATAVRRLTNNEHARRMMRRVEQLPETYREPLLLRALHGLRSKQIGEILEIPPATVDTRIARARRMLRETVETPGATQDAEASHDVLARIPDDQMRRAQRGDS